MFKKVLGILALSAIATMTWANVDLRTNIQDLYYKGSCEEAGAITMSVNGDDFTDASTDNPTFIRIRLDHDAVLCSSLVGSWSTRDNQGRLLDGFYGEPVFLAMRLEDKANPDNYILADPETVSIVRWIAGEGEIWLRVQSDSSTWIYSDTLGAPAPPAVNTGRVAWTFGVTAAKSYQRNQPLFTAVAQEANLPANTRDVTWETCTNDIYPSISTLICVDLEDATLMAMPDQS